MGEGVDVETEVVGPGVYQIHVLAKGYSIAKGGQINTDEQEDELQSIELSPGISLRGRVVDTNGEPVNDATVRALSLSTGAMPRVMNLFATYEGAVKTEDGYFEIEDDSFQIMFEKIKVEEGSNVMFYDHFTGAKALNLVQKMNVKS